MHCHKIWWWTLAWIALKGNWTNPCRTSLSMATRYWCATSGFSKHQLQKSNCGRKICLSLLLGGFPAAAGGPLWETGCWNRCAFGFPYVLKTWCAHGVTYPKCVRSAGSDLVTASLLLLQEQALLRLQSFAEWNKPISGTDGLESRCAFIRAGASSTWAPKVPGGSSERHQEKPSLPEMRMFASTAAWLFVSVAPLSLKFAAELFSIDSRNEK